MSKLLIMTDLHLTADGGRIIGLDPAQRFAEGMAHAAARHPDADRMILLGDLTHNGQPAEYAMLREILKDAPWPVDLILGNHDRRDLFCAAFPEVPVDPDGFVQRCVDLADTRLILLDSLDDGAGGDHSGYLCSRRLAWLTDALSGAGDRPCLIFVHHPPFTTGFSGMDAIGLRNAGDLRTCLADSPAVHLFAGHIHRTITATVGGIGMTVFKSPSHQMPMLLGQDGFGHSVAEPGAYGIVLLTGADVVVHFEDFTLPKQQIADF